MECDTLFYAFDAQMHYVCGYTVKGWAAFKVVCAYQMATRGLHCVSVQVYVYLCSSLRVLLCYIVV